MSNKEFGIVLQKFEVDGQPEMSEEEMISVLADRISEMLDTQPELLFSTLYRLDVFESKINGVLKSDIDTAVGLAHLVIERQKEKLHTKNTYREKDGWDEFIDV